MALSKVIYLLALLSSSLISSCYEGNSYLFNKGNSAKLFLSGQLYCKIYYLVQVVL
uniref:Uncharacterized protein n=1 Tax=Rhizophora mucronata TaxID=61149 RepID=A0A2P2PWE9_RHIMU